MKFKRECGDDLKCITDISLNSTLENLQLE